MTSSHPTVFKILSALALLAAPALADEVWTRGGPPGGVVTALAVSPRDPNVLFAGTDGGGVFLGTVSGGEAVWSPLGSEVVGGRVQALAVAPSAPDVLYASVGEIPLVSGVWKSTDGGATWAPVNRGLPSPPPFCSCGPLLPVYALAVHPRNPNVVYAGVGGGGVYKTVDGGRRWFPAGTQIGELSGVRSLLIDPVTPAILYAGAGDGVYKSTNGGASWTYVSTGLGERAVAALVLDPEDRRVVFAATRSGVFRSVDAGRRWRLARSIPQVLSLAAAARAGSGGSTIWAGAQAGVWRSADGGSSWRRGSGLGDLPVGALAVSPAQPRVVWAGTGSVGLRTSVYGPGVFRSADAGITWEVSNQGLFAARITSIGVSPEDSEAVLGTAGAGVFFAEGSGWVARNRGLTRPQLHVLSVARDPVDPEVVYAGTAQGLFKTVNGGESWEPRNAGLPVMRLVAGGVRDIVVDPTAPEVLHAAVHSFIYRSADGGATWTFSGSMTAFMEDLALDPGNPQVGYAAAGVLLRSTDGGSTWTYTQVPVGEAVLAVAVDEASRLLVGSYGKVLRSADGGETWEALPLPVGLPVQVVAAGSSPEQVWAGTMRGLYCSEDDGATWSLVPETRGASVTDVAVDASGPGSVLAATLGAGLFELHEGE
jgi:photosystem II stability/assembly factor-like uncharacterized protein